MCRKSFLKRVFLRNFKKSFLRLGFNVFKMTAFQVFRSCFVFIAIRYLQHVFEKVKDFQSSFPREHLSTAVTLYNLIQSFAQTEILLYVRDYLKSSQLSKIKLLAKVVNASRDVFRTVFIIQNVFRTSKMGFFTKIMNGWKQLTFSAKSSILDILLGPENASGFTVFNYFFQKPHHRSLRGQRCLCMYIVPQIWRWINEISKVCYDETQKDVSENSCSKNFVNF